MKAFDIRYNELGGEIVKAWAERSIEKHQAFEPYKLEWGEDKSLKRITHRRSGFVTNIPDDISITRAYKYLHPSSERMAALKQNNLRNYLCSDFFDPGMENGPQAAVLDKKGKVLKTIFSRAAAQVHEQDSAAVAPALAVPALHDHSKVRKAQALEKAREKLAATPAKRARIVEFST